MLLPDPATLAEPAEPAPMLEPMLEPIAPPV